MARFHSLHVYQLARANTRDIAAITDGMPGFGDLCSQMRRAAGSVQHNIAEGSMATRRMFIDRIVRARGEVNELQAQAEMLADLGRLDPAHPLHDRLEHTGRALSRLITHLRG